jgi:hypothetical protein
MGNRNGTVLFGTIVSMVFGDWISGKLFDFTGAFTPAFIKGIA